MSILIVRLLEGNLFTDGYHILLSFARLITARIIEDVALLHWIHNQQERQQREHTTSKIWKLYHSGASVLWSSRRLLCKKKLAVCLVFPLVGSQQTNVQTNKNKQTYKQASKKQTETYLVSSLRTGPWSDLDRSSFIFLARVLWRLGHRSRRFCAL